jgi:hypothetical protein
MKATVCKDINKNINGLCLVAETDDDVKLIEELSKQAPMFGEKSNLTTVGIGLGVTAPRGEIILGWRGEQLTDSEDARNKAYLELSLKLANRENQIAEANKVLDDVATIDFSAFPQDARLLLGTFESKMREALGKGKQP